MSLSLPVLALPRRTTGAPSRRRAAIAAVARDAALGFAVPLALLALWALAATLGWLPQQILPAPGTVVGTIRDGLADGSLQSSTLTSLRRVIEGFAAGTAVGLSLGFLLGLSRMARDVLWPLVLGLGQVPILGWLPIAVLVVGLDDGLKILVIGWAAFIPVVLNTARGVRDVPPAYRDLGRVLCLGHWTVLRLIVLPAAIPSIFTGLREGLAHGWQTLVAVELIASFEGLGYLMAYGRQLFQIDLVLSAMVVVGLVGLAFHLLLGAAEARVLRWRPEAER